jgi:hypothetical protein
MNWIARTTTIQANQADPIVHNSVVVAAPTKERAAARVRRPTGAKLEIVGYIREGRHHYFPRPIAMG